MASALPPDAMRRPKSHGLLGMRERALLLGGTLTVKRGVNGVGTCVQAWVPAAESERCREPNAAPAAAGVGGRAPVAACLPR